MRAVVTGITDIRLELECDSDRAVLAEMDKRQLWKSGSGWSPERGIISLSVGRPGAVKVWSDELPTQPGFYWAQDPRGGEPDIIEVYETSGEGSACGIGSDEQTLVSMAGYSWQGPIAPRRE